MKASGHDPITTRSLSGPLLAWSLLLLAALGWALYDETIGARPWKLYQKRFVTGYSAYLKSLQRAALARDAELQSDEQFRETQRQVRYAEIRAAPRLARIQQDREQVRKRLTAIEEPFGEARSKLAAVTYDLDHAASSGDRQARAADVKQLRDSLAPLQAEFTSLKAREAELASEAQRVLLESANLRREREEYRVSRTSGLAVPEIDALLRKIAGFRVEIKQIHVPEAGIVDRCESCHAGAREPLQITPAEIGNPVFASHPDPELLRIHDPERFGCTLCHNGNGASTTSVARAHGESRDWPWPLFAQSDTEAGCVQCHPNDRVLDHAPVLETGREVYQRRGCASCHRHREFDQDADEAAATAAEIRNLEKQQTTDTAAIDREIQLGDGAPNNDEARRHYTRSDNLRTGVSARVGRIAELNDRLRDFRQNRKGGGPPLKDARLKFRKEWLAVWLKDPQAYRPGTRMPDFRLSSDEARALAAFVWQSGVRAAEPPLTPNGDPAKGRELFETRGCLACHSMGEGAAQMGSGFAANLSRLGEKANFEYTAGWIHNPRERLRAACFEDNCVNDGTPAMPNFRLTTEESRDIATYLTGLRNTAAVYPLQVTYMDDPALGAAGRTLAVRYGCANCHDIPGLQKGQRVGTELTFEGSKPLDEFDFGLLERTAKRQGWYTRKGYFEHKLSQPALYDQGREKTPDERLRMPNISLSGAEQKAVVTFLLGSVEVPENAAFRTLPASFRYTPAGPARDIQDGWWIIRRYNCTGCHEIRAGHKSSFSEAPRYRNPESLEQLPPPLLQEGARVNPEWLTHFLTNPALNSKDPAGNGIRSYLAVRMPTFNFSRREIQTLVRFFEALSAQPSPWIPPASNPLSDRERQLARALFSSPGAPCLKCHVTGDARHDRTATAPNFLTAAARLKPAWTAQWMTEPQNVSPGTAMPSRLFHREGSRWVLSGEIPAGFRDLTVDHVDLLVRYMFQLNGEEQRRLMATMPAGH